MKLSPHVSEQESLVNIVPPVQVHPLMLPVQSERHPKPFSSVPSSQTSPVTQKPSPQIGVQTLFAPSVIVQVYLDSRVQVLEHPSKLTKFPSSQASPLRVFLMPSPQAGTQVEYLYLFSEHSKGASLTQRLAHPSPLLKPPSSHCSPASIRRFPHNVQTLSGLI